MKKQNFFSFWLLLTLSMATTVFTSCSKDSNDEPSNNTTISGISLDKTTLSLAVGASSTVIATVSPADATDKTVTWTSSDATKATVVNGIITGVAAGTATITAKAGEKTVTCTITVASSIPLYVVINGVKWATHNVAEPGTFTANPEDAGDLYQWNSKVGWPATGDIGSIIATDGSTKWNSSWTGGSTATDTWASANDPSPAGYRVPTYDEMQKLVDATKVTQKWSLQNGVYGEKFTDKTTGNSIFLPPAGTRTSLYGDLVNNGYYGDYWGSSANTIPTANSIQFNSGSANNNSFGRTNGLTVRPVAE